MAEVFTPQESAIINGTRPIIDVDLQNKIRRARAPLPFLWYDSQNIGPGQNDLSRGWFNTWAAMGNAQVISFFKGRDPNIDRAYGNITEETADFAVDIHAISIEFNAPTGYADRDTQANDTSFVPDLFTRQLPMQSAFRLSVQNGADEILQIPCNAAPGGGGVSQPQVAGAAVPSFVPGTNGNPQFSNRFILNNPFMLPAKASIQGELFIANPIRDILQNLPGPGLLQYTDLEDEVADSPKVYTMRVGLLGKRYLQLRGERSA